MNARISQPLNLKQRNIVKQECLKEFDRLLEAYNKEAVLQVLYILRFEYGFGQQRLKEFCDKLSVMQSKTVNRYEVKDEEVPDICEIKLRESGIDLSEFI